MLLNTSNSVLKKEHIYSLFTPNGCISMSTVENSVLLK